MSMAGNGLLVLRWPSTCKDTFKGSGASVVRPALTWISGHWRALAEMHWREFDDNFLSKPAEAISSLVYPSRVLVFPSSCLQRLTPETRLKSDEQENGQSLSAVATGLRLSMPSR